MIAIALRFLLVLALGLLFLQQLFEQILVERGVFVVRFASKRFVVGRDRILESALFGERVAAVVLAWPVYASRERARKSFGNSDFSLNELPDSVIRCMLKTYTNSGHTG